MATPMRAGWMVARLAYVDGYPRLTEESGLSEAVEVRTDLYEQWKAAKEAYDVAEKQLVASMGSLEATLPML